MESNIFDYCFMISSNQFIAKMNQVLESKGMGNIRVESVSQDFSRARTFHYDTGATGFIETDLIKKLNPLAF